MVKKFINRMANNSKNSVIFLDFILIFAAFFIAAFFLNSRESIGSALIGHRFLILAFAAVYLLCFYLLKLYNYIWAQAGVYEFLKLAAACMITVAVLSAASALIYPGAGAVRLTLLGGIFSAFAIAALRVLFKAARAGGGERYTSPRLTINNKNVLIYGAGTAAAHLIEDFASYGSGRVNIVGIIDDDPAKKNRRIRNVTVLGGGTSLLPICEEHKVDEIIIAIPSLQREEKRRIVSICRTTGCRVRTTPDIDEIMHGRLSLYDVRDVVPEDLLGRHTVELDAQGISGCLSGKVVLITGGGGSIGSELCRQVLQFSPRELIVIDAYENNIFDIEYELREAFPKSAIKFYIASIRDREKLDKIFADKRPDVVFHAAAHKHVPLMEQNPDEAVKNNVFGTLNVALSADKYGARKFIMISTDKAVNPTNIMGATKRLCEKLIQAINDKSETDFIAVRFGNVMGSNGSVIPLFKKQIRSGGPITVTHKNVTRFFMTTPEAAQLVIQALAYAEGGEIFVLDMGKPVKIYDMARELIELSGLVPGKDILIKFTGLRPGEKLYEELITAQDNLKKTRHSKILVEKAVKYDFNTLMKKLDKLMKVVDAGDNAAIKKEIRKLVPTYSPGISAKLSQMGAGGSAATV